MGLPKLQRGNFAPRISATTIAGRAFDSEAMTGQKLWIAFYRYASCPMCELHFSEVMKRAAELKTAGVRFVAIYESELENIPPKIIDFARNGLDVIADKNKFFYDKYGVEVSWPKLFAFGTAAQAVRAHMNGLRPGVIDGNLATIPAHFLIFSGVIYEPHYGRNAGDHIPFDRVVEFGRTQFEEPQIEVELE